MSEPKFYLRQIVKPSYSNAGWDIGRVLAIHEPPTYVERRYEVEVIEVFAGPGAMETATVVGGIREDELLAYPVSLPASRRVEDVEEWLDD